MDSAGEFKCFFAGNRKNEQTVKNAGKRKKVCPNDRKCAIIVSVKLYAFLAERGVRREGFTAETVAAESGGCAVPADGMLHADADDEP